MENQEMAETQNLESPVTPQEPEASLEPGAQGQANAEATPEAVQEEGPGEDLDLNQLFPDEDTDLNQLFPEKELRELLQGVHKSKSELEKINTRFVDDPDHVVPKLEDEDSQE